MSHFEKVIFVCSGNTCQSPMAATIMNSLKEDREIYATSRGMVVLFPEPYNTKAIAVLSAHGLIMPSNSTMQISEEDFGNNILVLTMDESQRNKIYSTFNNAINVYTLSEYAGEEGSVVDPYGKGIEEYAKCYDELIYLIKKVIEKIFKEEEK